MFLQAQQNGTMTYPRSQIVAEGESGFFHVLSRCGRRAFLCGHDKASGQCFEHRRQWIEARILELAECFAVSVYVYAVIDKAEQLGQVWMKGVIASTAKRILRKRPT